MADEDGKILTFYNAKETFDLLYIFGFNIKDLKLLKQIQSSFEDRVELSILN